MIFGNDAAVLSKEGLRDRSRIQTPRLTTRRGSLDRDAWFSNHIGRICGGIRPTPAFEGRATLKIKQPLPGNRLGPNQRISVLRRSLVQALRLTVRDEIADGRSITPIFQD
jgi:hypothetical protein